MTTTKSWTSSTSSPRPISDVDIVVHEHDDGKRYLACGVHQFDDSPVVCRNNSPVAVKGNDRLAAGGVLRACHQGKRQTVKVIDAAQMNDLLELAAEFRARRMLEVGKRIGLVPGETAAAKFEAELPPILREDRCNERSSK